MKAHELQAGYLAMAYNPYESPSPAGAGGYMAAYPPQRPVSVTVLAILGIIFGAINVLCTPFGLLPFLVDTGQPNPMIDVFWGSPFFFGWMIFSVAASFILGVVLLLGSIGSLQLRPVARKLMLIYAVAALVMAVAGFAINVVIMLPLLEQIDGGGPMMAGVLGGLVGGVVGLLFGSAFPVAILYFYTRPNVKAAFAGPTPVSGTADYA